TTLVDDLLNLVGLANAAPTNELDGDVVFGRDALGMFSQPIAQWLGKLRVVEDADLTRVQVVGHCLRVAKVWNRSLDDQPVIAAEDAHDMIGKSVGRQLRTHRTLPLSVPRGSGAGC